MKRTILNISVYGNSIRSVFCLLVFLFIPNIVLFSQGEGRMVISLNGVVEFDQTKTAFPPKRFKKSIPVPGLIDQAIPILGQKAAYFSGIQEPRYSWYKFRFWVPPEMKEKTAILTLLKSRFNTQIILNGHDCGTYRQCNTPVEAALTDFLDFEKENILLVRLGDRAWLPKEAATGFDREKITDFPGIWDDVFITFTGPLRVNRCLALPDLKGQKVTVKLKLENYAKLVERNTEYSSIEYSIRGWIREKKSGRKVTEEVSLNGIIKCQKENVLEFDVDMREPHAWSPEDPFLYEAVVMVSADGLVFNNYGNPENLKPAGNYSWIGDSDKKVVTFGMRDFKAVSKTFHLNGEEYRFIGSTFTLNRFFEDPERKGLPWDKEWVKKLMVDIPKSLGWNFFRVSIGLLPSFWYDLADEYGFIIQNEYPMWNLRGRDIGYEIEYTDWVWTDGNHPGIVIWDALNEQKEPFLGNVLIPELRKLDPTRIWDAGWMEESELDVMEMKEVHWYSLAHGWWSPDNRVEQWRKDFRFGGLFNKYSGLQSVFTSSAPVILNEYGWLWLNRDGRHSGIRTYGEFREQDKVPFRKNYEYFEPDGSQLYTNRDVYDYFLGKEATAEERWAFQAYLLGIETEIIRSTRQCPGIASFAYLTNNKGYTGDWFKGKIKKLNPSQALLVQYHTAKPFAVFIDVEDGRYLKNPSSPEPGSLQSIDLFAVNDSKIPKSGMVKFSMINAEGKNIWTREIPVSLKPFWQKMIPLSIEIPGEKGGYMLLSELYENSDDNIPQVSRRYIRVGEDEKMTFPEYVYELPKGWPGE